MKKPEKEIKLITERAESYFIGRELCEEYGISVSAPFYGFKGEIIAWPINIDDVFSRDLHNRLLPNIRGWYYLFFNNQLVYIGMSTCIKNRLIGHYRDRDMPFTHVIWFPADCYKPGMSIKEILEIEQKMIGIYRPVLNSAGLNSV
jgi:hypothetical protein